MSTRLVTGTVHNNRDQIWPGAVVMFQHVSGAYTTTATYPVETTTTVADAAGQINVVLVSGLNVAWICRIGEREQFRFNLPDGGPITIEQLRALSGTSQPAQTPLDAEAAARTAGDAVLQQQITSLGGGLAPVQAENKDTVTLAPGQPVAATISGVGVVRAVATDLGLRAVGLMGALTSPTFAGPIRTTGELTLNDWSAATGTTLLVPRARYYLDSIAGRISPVAPVVPTLAGHFAQAVGTALTPHTLIVQMMSPILL